MRRRKELTEDELRIIKKKISEYEEAYEAFFKDCIYKTKTSDD